jgi:DNA ligase (NAD+)
MRPLGQIAWKFPSTMKSSKIVDVQWQIGPSGRITPVAKIEPIEIEGVTITSVSLHNMSIFNELNLHLNDEVLVSRRNQVIPYIEKNLSRFGII